MHHLDKLFILKPDELHSAIINLEYIGVGKYGERVLDLLWQIGFRFIPDGLLQRYVFTEKMKKERWLRSINKVRDWRNVVRDYLDRLPEEKKDTRDWSRKVSDKY